MESGTIIGILTALGVGGVLTKLIEGLVGWFQGRHRQEQSAWERADSEASRRRRTEEVLHETRRILNEHGVPYAEMPPWPARTTRKT